MDPVGYKRVNKKTGKEIDRDDIVKGVEYEDGKYVVISPAEIEAVYPRTTQTIEIQRFVDAKAIPFVFLERPYYVAPINRGAKVYALLRETLQRSGRVGVARVVIQTKQHLAVLVPVGPGLVLNLLRWGADIRPWKDLPLPSESARKAGLTERELKMAKELVDDMSADWNPDDYKDSFKDEIMRMVDERVEAGQTEEVTQPEPEEETGKSSAKILDLTELLQRSLRKGGDKKEEPKARKPLAKSAARKRAPAKTAARRKAA
jgi:DNA end-binding protein Ku